MIHPQFFIRYFISRKNDIRDREREGGGERGIDSTLRCIAKTARCFALSCIFW